jgi:hypothetical protein
VRVTDAVHRPAHYVAHPSGVECITISRALPFAWGNALKYAWRAPLKNGSEDLQKAAWYVRDAQAHNILPHLTGEAFQAAHRVVQHEQTDSPVYLVVETLLGRYDAGSLWRALERIAGERG